jgi:arylformamidase
MPLDAVNGPCRVIGIADREAIRSAELVRQEIAPGERLLFKTRNRLDGPFDESFVFLAAEAARYLAGRGVRSIGVDGPSIGGFHHDLIETHQTILGAGIWVIECLDLTAVAPGRYELICLPLKIVGADGAPARAMLRALA